MQSKTCCGSTVFLPSLSECRKMKEFEKKLAEDEKRRKNYEEHLSIISFIHP